MAIPDNLESLKHRLGEDHLRERLLRQANHWAGRSHMGEGLFRVDQWISIDRLARAALKATGLWERAHRNIYDFEVVEVEWRFPTLPAAFDGFRLLQLTDLHVDVDPDLPERIASRVRDIPHDAAVFTGDYRDTTYRDHAPSMRAIVPVIEATRTPRFGILGNHDFIEKVPDLEAAGLPMLLNEAAPIERGSDRIWIAGVDDPHFYHSHDFARARKDIPQDAFSILLCHTPEAHREAAQYGFDLMLSGHTHAGQICIPGGRHLMCPVRNLPARYIKGKWSSGPMHGYTSRGTGCCGVPARLNCPPEITVHVLRTA